MRKSGFGRCSVLSGRSGTGSMRTKRCRGELMQELFGKELKGSVTRSGAVCGMPVSVLLHLRADFSGRGRSTRWRPVDLGNLFHRALEMFSRRLRESDYHWKDIPEEVADAWLTEAVDRAAGEDSGDVLHSSARNQYKVQVVERILKRTVRVLKKHLENSHMEPDRVLSFISGGRTSFTPYIYR